MRDVGDMGEFEFGKLCSAVGITANKSAIDKAGWDFFLDFPIQPDESKPRDMWPSPIECKIQVKSTDNQEKKRQVKVSNLNRLINAKMPAFFLFIEFDGLETPQAAYLVHVGKEIIEKTLKRMRELDIKGEKDRLHERTITIHYGDDQKLDKPTGQHLKSEIEKYIPEGMEKYVEEKNNLLKTLGFDEGAGQVTFTVSGKQPLEEMVDLSLGIRDSIKVSGFVGYHKRFGILSKEPFVDHKGGKISLEAKPMTKATVTVKEYEFSPSISFDGYMYLPPINRMIPKEYIKFRIETEFFDAVFEPYNGKAKISYTIKNVIEYPLRNIRNMLKALTLFRKSKDGVILGAEPENLPPFSVKIFINEDVDDYSSLYEIAEEASQICSSFGISEGILVSLDSLLSYGKNIKDFHSVINSDPKLFNIKFESEDLKLEENQEAACIFLISTLLGSSSIACFVAFLGIPKMVGPNKWDLYPDDKKIGPKFVAKRDETVEQENIEKECNKFIEEFEKNEIPTIRLMDFK